MSAVLVWIGGRARWVLAVGVLLAGIAPDLSAALRPWLPWLVAMVFCLAMARLDLGRLARTATRPRRLFHLGLWVLGLMALTPALLWGLGQALGLPETHLAALVYTGAAPPIASATGLCLMMGLDAALALELTVVASLATPLLGPLVVAMLLGETVPVDPVALGLRIAAMIAAGAVAAVVLRRVLGPAWIASHARAFDGVAAIALLIFVIPLFDGVWALIGADPWFALEAFALALVANLGLQAGVAALMRLRLAAPSAGAAGLVAGNRTVALYLAALPPDPAFALYVALFQVPMLFTPLVMGRVLGASRPT